MRDTIVCVASGESLTRADVNYCRGKARVLAINDNYRIAPWADWLYACDGRWWDVYGNAVQESFGGECWTRDHEAAKRYGLHWVRSLSHPGLSFDPAYIHEGGNSGYQAINLAVHFGAKRILLLGYDMGGNHWFGDHPKSLPVKSNYQVFMDNFATLPNDLKTAGVEVVNCSRKTELAVFPRSTIKREL